MLRKIRIILAAIFFSLITLLFLDFTGTLHTWLRWMAKIQLLPAVMAVNVGIVVALLLVTLVFGRVYCSIICPLGVMQDIISWISSRRKKKINRFGFSPAKNILRYTVLGIFIIAMVAGFNSFAILIAPYSAYGRIASSLFAPLYGWGNNVLAYLAERADSYAFYSTDVWMKSGLTLGIAAMTFIVIAILAWRGGRTYCNTICPVGSVLGLISRFAYLRPHIDTSKCVGCKVCARRCKASCINPEEHSIDYSRCVACMDCLHNCSSNAIIYSHPKKIATPAPATPADGEKGTSRRKFLSITALLAATAAIKAQKKNVDGGLATLKERKISHRTTPIVPAGALSLNHFTTHCTGCQLCVSACPNGVLRPSSDLNRLMQPEMSYERGACRPECVKCAEVCPTGAIRPITQAVKSSTQIGHAIWVKENCLVFKDGIECGNCARHCPNGAIRMTHINEGDPESPKFPIVDAERCIGCGSCEYVCPARPFSAIFVEGNQQQHTI